MKSEEYKIEKGIPIKYSQKINSNFPFSKMEVGDSFSIKYEDYKDMSAKRLRVCNDFKKFIVHNKNGWKYCTRKDDELKIIRVWRTQ